MALPTSVQLPPLPAEKRCPICGLVKPRADFGSKRDTADRLQAYCRLCMRAYRRQRSGTQAPEPQFWHRNHFATFEDYFWSRVNKDGPIPARCPERGPCWLWLGELIKRTGYGQVGREGRNYRAHRLSYELLIGPIPLGLELDHLCKVRHCVNPAHLEPVTGKVNKLRGDTFNARNAAKTHCPKGHPYDEKNTYMHPRGLRCCRQCANARMREKTRRRKLASSS